MTMSPKITLVLVCLFVFALPFGSSSSAAPAEQFEPVSIDLAEASLERVLWLFADMADAELRLSTEVERRKLTIRLDRAAWTTALDALCQTAECQWSLQSGHPRILSVEPSAEGEAGFKPPGQRISMTLRDAHAHEVLSSFGRILQVATDIDPQLEGPVSITLERVAASTALDALCENLGCAWQLTPEEDPQTLLVRARAVPGTLRLRAPERDDSDVSAAKLAQSIDVELIAVPPCDIFRYTGHYLSAAVLCDPDLDSQKIDVHLQDVPLRELYEHVCALSDCTWQLEPDPQTPALRVVAGSR